MFFLEQKLNYGWPTLGSMYASRPKAWAGNVPTELRRGRLARKSISVVGLLRGGCFPIIQCEISWRGLTSTAKHSSSLTPSCSEVSIEQISNLDLIWGIRGWEVNSNVKY